MLVPQMPINTLVFPGSSLAPLSYYRKALHTPRSHRAASRTWLLELGAPGGPSGRRAPQSCCAMTAHPHANCTPQAAPAAPEQGSGPPKPRDLFDDNSRLFIAWCREVSGLLDKEQRNLHADGMFRVALITCSTPAPGEKGSASQGEDLEDLASGSIPELPS